jgi:SPOR domain
MAVSFHDGHRPGQSGTSRTRGQKITHLTGAAISLGLLGGAAWWGYDLAMRDVRGVPVVRALEGPLRVAPENPGGEQAAHQGLAVNSVAAMGSAAPVAEQLTLAPRPVDLAPEDRAGLPDAAPEVAALPQPAGPEVSRAVELVAELSGEAPPEAVSPEALAEDTEVLVDAALSEALAETAPDSIPETLLLSDPALAGMRPRARPAAVPEAQGPETLAATPVPEAPELDPAALQSGTALVQLGSFDDVESARAAWIKVAQAHPDQMAGRARVVEPAQRGGRNFVRLRVHGFADEAASRAFCAVVLTTDRVCIPVTVE